MDRFSSLEQTLIQHFFYLIKTGGAGDLTTDHLVGGRPSLSHDFLSLVEVRFPIVLAQIQGEAMSSAAGGNGSAVKYRGVFGTITTMVRTEGPRSLYSGLVAGLQRQMSFASVRIGLYDSVKQFYTRGSEREYL